MIRLERELAVSTFDLEATVALGRDRPEYLAVASLASGLERPIGGADVCRELLGGLPETLGWRVLDRCVAIGLLERDDDGSPARLSELGRAALESGSVMVPEEGVWRFYVVRDPLADALIHVARFEPPHANDELKTVYAAKNGHGGRPEAGASVPDAVREAARDQIAKASVATGKAFAIQRIADRGANGPSGGLKLTVEWPAGGDPTVRLRGRLEPPAGAREQSAWVVDRILTVPTVLSAITYNEMWPRIAAGLGGVLLDDVRGWCNRAAAPVFPVSFDGLAARTRATMQATIDGGSIDLGPLGRFDASPLRDVALVPRTDADAQHWAEFLQKDAIQAYTLPDRLATQARDILARFPYHRPALPGANALLQTARTDPLVPWARWVLAPSDLGLWR